MKILTLLHVSDIHRSKDDPVTNAELAIAMLHDRDRYVIEQPAIARPDGIIISGDIVQGIPIGEENWASKIREQYREAEELIRLLAANLVDGDLSRVVIVPGNHDVCWNTALSSMKEIEPKKTGWKGSRTLHKRGLNLRWDWNELKLYEITDVEKYERRLDAYWEFVDRLYSGVNLTLRPNRVDDFGLFEFLDGRVCIVAYNSCATNDCFSFAGDIRREVIAKSGIKMRELGIGSRLRIAVWHHNIEGPPTSSDYIDIDIVRNLLVGGIRLGLHGHQHHSQITPQRIWLPDEQTMAVISAGSLCAGPLELPTGANRQYNVVEISDDFLSANIHTRGRTAGNMFGKLQLQELGGRSFSLVNWSAVPVELGGGISDIIASESRILCAETLVRAGSYAAALEKLAPIKNRLGPLGKATFIAAAAELELWSDIKEIASPPESLHELSWLVNAYIKLHEFDGARSALDNPEHSFEVPASLVADLNEIGRASCRERV